MTGNVRPNHGKCAPNWLDLTARIPINMFHQTLNETYRNPDYIGRGKVMCMKLCIKPNIFLEFVNYF